MPRRPEEPDDTYADEALTITPEQVCFIIVKAREFDVKEANDEQDSGSNPSDDREMEVLEDPVQQEIAEFISAMNEDEQIDLVALAGSAAIQIARSKTGPPYGRRPRMPAHPLV